MEDDLSLPRRSYESTVALFVLWQQRESERVVFSLHCMTHLVWAQTVPVKSVQSERTLTDCLS